MPAWPFVLLALLGAIFPSTAFGVPWELQEGDLGTVIETAQQLRTQCVDDTVEADAVKKLRNARKKLKSLAKEQVCEVPETELCQAILNLVWSLSSCVKMDSDILPQLLNLTTEPLHPNLTFEIEASLGQALSLENGSPAVIRQLLDLVRDDGRHWPTAHRIISIGFQDLFKNAAEGDTRDSLSELMAEVFERRDGKEDWPADEFLEPLRISLTESAVAFLDNPVLAQEAAGLLLDHPDSAGATLNDLGRNLVATPETLVSPSTPSEMWLEALALWLEKEIRDLSAQDCPPAAAAQPLASRPIDLRARLAMVLLGETATSQPEAVRQAVFVNLLRFGLRTSNRELLTQGSSFLYSVNANTADVEEIYLSVLESAIESCDLSAGRILLETAPSDRADAGLERAILLAAAGQIGPMHWRAASSLLLKAIDSGAFRQQGVPSEENASTGNRIALGALFQALVDVLKTGWLEDPTQLRNNDALQFWRQAKQASLTTLALARERLRNFAGVDYSVEIDAICVEALRRGLNASDVLTTELEPLASLIVQQRQRLDQAEAWLMIGTLVDRLKTETSLEQPQHAATTLPGLRSLLTMVFRTLAPADAEEPRDTKGWAEWRAIQLKRPPF